MKGYYYAGSTLPSQRNLAKEYNVSRFTISQAMEVLQYSGLLKIEHGKKAVVFDPPVIRPDWQRLAQQGGIPNRHWKEHIDNSYVWPRLMSGLATDFGAARLVLPALDRAAKRLYEPENYELLTVEGLPSVLEAYREYLDKKGIRVSSKELLITTGEEQGLTTIARGLFSSNLYLFYAVPSIFQSIAKFESTGIRKIAIPMDEEGILPEKLLKYSKYFNKAILYLEPVGATPWGNCMSNRRCEELCKIIENTPMPVIEKDQNRPFWGKAAKLPTFKERMPDKVIYLDASLKSFFPNISIACIAASEYIISRLTDIKVQNDYITSSLNQLLAEELLTSGELDGFFEITGIELEKRKNQTHELLQRYLGKEARWTIPEAGLFFWLRFNKINTVKLGSRLKDISDFKAQVIPGSVFDPADNRHLLLGYTNVDMGRIENAIRILCVEIKQMRRGS